MMIVVVVVDDGGDGNEMLSTLASLRLRGMPARALQHRARNFPYAHFTDTHLTHYLSLTLSTFIRRSST